MKVNISFSTGNNSVDWKIKIYAGKAGSRRASSSVGGNPAVGTFFEDSALPKNIEVSVFRENNLEMPIRKVMTQVKMSQLMNLAMLLA